MHLINIVGLNNNIALLKIDDLDLSISPESVGFDLMHLCTVNFDTKFCSFFYFPISLLHLHDGFTGRIVVHMHRGQ